MNRHVPFASSICKVIQGPVPNLWDAVEIIIWSRKYKQRIGRFTIKEIPASETILQTCLWWYTAI
jgi:hypothetical protein